LSIGDSLLFYFEKPRGFWRAPQIARELPTAMTLIEWRIYRQGLKNSEWEIDINLKRQLNADIR